MPELTSLTLVNGKFVDQLAVTDRGLAYGDGVFETLHWVSGHLPYWPLHQQRLQWGCERLAIPLLLSQLHDSLAQLRSHPASDQITQGVLKVIVTRGSAGRGYRPPEQPTPTLIVTLAPVSSQSPTYTESGVAVYLCRYPLPHNPALAGIKHLNRLDYVLAANEFHPRDYQEGLLRDKDGRIIEALSRNVFMVRAGQLITPSLDQAGVAGVMRRLIMETLAPQLGLRVLQQAVTLTDLQAADEVFLTNSVTGIWPVRAVDNYQLPPAKPITQQLIEAVATNLTERMETRDV